MTLGRYLSNAKKKKFKVKEAYNFLLQEFEKGTVSYPRTNGINHSPLIMLEPQKIITDIQQIIIYDDTKPFDYNLNLQLNDIDKDKQILDYIKQNDIYIIAEEFNLVSSGGLMETIESLDNIREYKEFKPQELITNLKELKSNMKLIKDINYNQILTGATQTKDIKIITNSFNI